MDTMNELNGSSQTLDRTEGLTMTSPFPFLSASDLSGLAAFFAADPAAVSVNIVRNGVTHVVTARDLAFIHQLDASRFGGTVAECPFCAADEAEIRASL